MALETEPIRIRGSTRATATAWWMRRDPQQPLPRPSCSRYESVNDRWSGSLLGRVPPGFEPGLPPCSRCLLETAEGGGPGHAARGTPDRIRTGATALPETTEGGVPGHAASGTPDRIRTGATALPETTEGGVPGHAASGTPDRIRTGATALPETTEGGVPGHAASGTPDRIRTGATALRG